MNKFSPARIRTVMFTQAMMSRRRLGFGVYIVRDKRDPLLQIHRAVVRTPFGNMEVFFYGRGHDGKSPKVPLIQFV